ncbi:MAG: hypothetical protein HY290_25985 [Planctomycetia bacterium]|nr:hypothetical protein [Planctomycetia bacterium]
MWKITSASGPNMKKSTRHSKITGEFAEALVLYWLSKYGFECARVDHTGIDLIARSPDNSEVMGISVKSRSRYAGTEGKSVNLPATDFVKAARACEAFHCSPYLAIVVDGSDIIRCFLTRMDHAEKLLGNGKVRYWRMDRRALDKYRNDPQIKGFEIHTHACSWRDTETECNPSADRSRE